VSAASSSGHVYCPLLEPSVETPTLELLAEYDRLVDDCFWHHQSMGLLFHLYLLLKVFFELLQLR
jgi:hypothetical protein